jgi:3-hydroxyacyl-CoA dehydrogenase
MLNQGNTSFYKEENGRELVYNPNTGSYEPVRVDPELLSLDALRQNVKEVARNKSASLLDLGDGVLCFEIHSKASAIDPGVIEMGRQALTELESDRWVGMVIGNEAKNFCVGANLVDVATAAKEGQWDQLRQSIGELQNLVMSFRFSSKPVVAAPHGQTLGGGAEIVMHSDRIVAAAETYMGLVEAGVGLLPAGGGLKEMVRRLISKPIALSPDAPPLLFAQKAFETVAQAKVSASALEARKLGFLTEADTIVMNPDHVLAAAKRTVLDLAENYRPPESRLDIFAAGQPTLAALEVGLQQMLWAGYATEYDGVVARQIAYVLCGGDLSAPQWVGEEYILKLEQDGFLSLLHNEKTIERIQAMLTTGKPLRN